MGMRELLIGAGPGGPAAERISFDADAFTTHGVILGMTGSGKTGLAVVLLEELARRRVPLVICDLKGDLTNLLLNFPRLEPGDFLPWVPGDTADRATAAAEVAGRWRQGLAPWGLGEAEIRQVREGLSWNLLTPGSGLAPVDLLPALDTPTDYDPDIDPDGARSRLDGTAAAILALVERGGDPLSDRDHVLVATLLDATWRQGGAMTLPELIRQISDPPVAQFGVLDAETFYPKKERQDLVRALNTVLASPAFAVWTRGVPLTAEAFVGPVGAPRATILYLAHLGDREKASFLTLLFSNLLSWARSQPGTEHLRALLYLDEVQGIIPPTALPPTKPPLLTLLKQGRAFGVGVVLATQNPVDLDYKALGNMGIKLVGRLDTEQDRDRALAGLDLQASDASATVAGLKVRQFLLAGAKAGTPRVVASRWAMSYLRGPLTLAELKPLLAAGAADPTTGVATAAGEAGAPASVAAPAAASAARPAPLLLSGWDQLFGAGDPLHPHVLVEAEVVVRKASPSIERRLSKQWLAPLVDGRIGWDRLSMHDLLTLDDRAPEGARLAELPGNVEELLRAADREFVRELDSQSVEVAFHRKLRLVQEEDESRGSFEARCRATMDPAGDPRVEALRRGAETKLRRIDEKLAKERADLAREQEDAAARSRDKTMAVATGVGEALFGALFGRGRGLGTLARRGASTARAYSSKDRMADSAQARAEATAQLIADLEAERERLAGECETELAALQAQAEDVSAVIEVLRLTPAAKDIAVRRVALAWVGMDPAK